MILLKKRQLDPRFEVGPKLLLLIHSNSKGRFYIIQALRNQLKPKMATFHLFFPDASRLPQRLGACRLPNLRTTTGLDVFTRFVGQYPIRHSRKYFFSEISNILWLMVYQVWILGPGDVPTAAHELWEDDRMELLVRKFCGHFFPALVI